MNAEQAVRDHYRLAMWYADKHYTRLLPYEDRLQACLVGLMQAARKFDRSLGFKFASYATTCMWRELSRCAARQAYSVALPLQVEPLARRAASMWALHTQPTPDDIKRHNEPLSDDVVHAVVGTPGHMLSMERKDPRDLDGEPLHDTYPDDVDVHREVEDRNMTAVLQRFKERLFDVLQGRNRDICESYYLHDSTYRELATVHGLTYQRIQQIVAAGTRKMRQRAYEETVDKPELREAM